MDCEMDNGLWIWTQYWAQTYWTPQTESPFFWGVCISLAISLSIVPHKYNNTAVCGNWNLCTHSYATHNYLLNDSRVAFPTVMHSSHLNFGGSVYCVPCAIFFPQSLQSRVYNPWNEQNGSENERNTIKLHPNSADCLMSICGANFKPSKSMSSLYCNVLH